ncbi:tetratricopeptide repeat protein [Singulisphaera sp. PoT]|uniref:tetratricopeptide repeat protein n=1 Tax=Singulisphaera sp. PoT TaxID=3411797 RepID=UPI003BF5CF3C
MRSTLALTLALILGATAKGQEPAPEARKIPDALNFANGLFRDKRYELAAQEYERFLKEAKSAPDIADAWFGLANARLFRGQYDLSRRAFEAFIKAAPEHPNTLTAQYRIGETSYMLGDLPYARRAFESFVAKAKTHKNLETAWPYLGEVCLRMRDYPRARQAYEESLSKNPDGRLADRARFGLGKALTALNEPDEARKVLTELAKRGGEWAERAWLQLGQVEMNTGRNAEAVTAYETLEQVAPKSPLIAEAKLNRAEALIKLDRRDEAETLLKTLGTDASRNVGAQAAFALGSSQLERGQAAEALETLDGAKVKFAKSTMNSAIAFRGAEASLKLGKTEDARTRFLQIVKADGKDPLADDALIRAARITMDGRDFKGAKALIASFNSRYPDSPLKSDAHLIEARVAMAEERYKDAVATLEKSLAEDQPSPENVQAERYYLGLAYRNDGQSEKADEILATLAKSPTAPAGTNAQYLLGQGHFEAKRYAEAIPALEAYLASKPAGDVAADALTRIVWARLELGQVDEASKSFGELAEKFPKHKDLNQTRLRLAWNLLDKEKPEQAAAAFAAVLAAAPEDTLAPEAALGVARAQDAAKQVDQALESYAKVAENYPQSEQATLATLARARLLVEAKKPAEGAEIYDKFFRDHVDPTTIPKGTEIDALLSEWGWALVDAGKTAEADATFARLLKEFPDSPHAADARVNLADTAYREKKYDEVLNLLNPLVAEGATLPERVGPSALLLMAQAQDKRKEWPAAAKTLDRLDKDFKENPYRREAKFLRADVALKNGEAEAAEAGFAALIAEPAAETDPERFGAALRRARIQCLLTLKRWEPLLAAADEFKAQVSKDPLMAEVDYARGQALQSLGRFDDAREAYKAVIEARKGGELAARAQFMRGETYFHQKNYEEARREFFMVDTLYDAPSLQAAALLEAGKVYERLDRWDLAAETYEGLRAKFPDDPKAADAKGLLEAAKQHAQASSGTETR